MRAFLIELIEHSVAITAFTFIGFGIYRGIHNTEKLVLVPIGVVLAGFLYWWKRRQK